MFLKKFWEENTCICTYIYVVFYIYPYFAIFTILSHAVKLVLGVILFQPERLALEFQIGWIYLQSILSIFSFLLLKGNFTECRVLSELFSLSALWVCLLIYIVSSEKWVINCIIGLYMWEFFLSCWLQ